MKRVKIAVAVGAVFASASWASVATAATTPITFDTNGAAAGGQISVSTFDWLPGNALAVGATPLSTVAATPTAFTLYAQASLGSFVDSGGGAIGGTGLGSAYEITFQTGFSELGVNSILPGTALASFGLDITGPVNFFNIYYDTAKNANNLTGAGFGDGTLIMTAIVTANSTFFGVPLDARGNPALDFLDQFTGDGNNYPTVGTVVGSGGGSLEGSVTSQDFDYFKSDFSKFSVDLFFNTSNIDPFNQADPSAQVVGNTPVFGAATPTYTGGVNGFGNGVSCPVGVANCDFMFQSDANQSFQAAIPEPASLALAGLALAGLGISRRRREQ